MAEMKATRLAYAETLVKLGATNDKIVVFDADLAHSTMTIKFKEKYPDRFFNVGIAENNLIDMAAGFSTMGYIPFVSSFAMFGIGRAYEMIRNSVGYGHMNVKLAMTHAGISVGEDGSSHQCIEDVALMRVIPGMTVIVPADATETERAVKAAVEMDGPVYLRLARLATPVFEQEMPFEIGKANVLTEGDDLAIFCNGYMVYTCLNAAEKLREQGKKVSVINVHTVKPIDAEKVMEYANRCGKVMTVEEHSVIGGLGDAVASVLIGNGSYKFRKLGIQDRFGQSGKPDELFEEYGISQNAVVKAALEMIG